MAKPIICKLEGCDKPASKRGWCWAHYLRWWKYGNPLAGSTFHGEPEKFLRETVILFDGDECLIWPYCKDNEGYGQIARNGPKYGAHMQRVHRIACEARHGPPPSSKHEAAHNCGKGHEGCVNPKHLRWATPKENEADKLVHGTSNRGERHGMAKLTESKVRQIRTLKGQIEPYHIATRFRVSQGAVYDIHAGRTWAWLD